MLCGAMFSSWLPKRPSPPLASVLLQSGEAADTVRRQKTGKSGWQAGTCHMQKERSPLAETNPGNHQGVGQFQRETAEPQADGASESR